MSRLWRRCVVAVGATIALLAVPAVMEAVWVSPTALFITDRDRNAHVTIGNSSDVPEEVTIEVKFGYLDTDSTGTPFIRLLDDPPPDLPSAAEWLGFFPLRARLEPGEKRVVRIFARPPADLPEGEYWSRLIVTSRRALPPATQGDSAARAGVSLEIRLVTSVTYRKGEVATGIVLTGMTAVAEGDSLVVRVGMDRLGNASYLGTGTFEIVDGAGEAVRSWSTPLAVYVPINRRFEFPLDGLAAGDYTLRLRVEAERPDIPGDHVLPAPAAADSIPLRVS